MIRRRNAKKYILKRSTCEDPIRNPRISRYKENLKNSAKKFAEYDDFYELYWKGGSRGTYWIPTDDETPLDLEKYLEKKGSIIAYISPMHISTSEFAAEVNTALLEPEDFKKNIKDPVNSIKITAPDRIIVNYIYPIKKAREVFKYNSRYLPSSGYELREFWNWAEKEPATKPRPIEHRKRKKKNDTKKETN
jgi:hypothetical protein